MKHPLAPPPPPNSSDPGEIWTEYTWDSIAGKILAVVSIAVLTLVVILFILMATGEI